MTAGIEQDDFWRIPQSNAYVHNPPKELWSASDGLSSRVQYCALSGCAMITDHSTVVWSHRFGEIPTTGSEWVPCTEHWFVQAQLSPVCAYVQVTMASRRKFPLQCSYDVFSAALESERFLDSIGYLPWTTWFTDQASSFPITRIFHCEALNQAQDVTLMADIISYTLASLTLGWSCSLWPTIP